MLLYSSEVQQPGRPDEAATNRYRPSDLIRPHRQPFASRWSGVPDATVNTGKPWHVGRRELDAP